MPEQSKQQDFHCRGAGQMVVVVVVVVVVVDVYQLDH